MIGDGKFVHNVFVKERKMYFFINSFFYSSVYILIAYSSIMQVSPKWHRTCYENCSSCCRSTKDNFLFQEDLEIKKSLSL